MVFARSDAGRVEGAEEIAAMARLCEQAGADLVLTTDEEAEGRMLMAARRLAFTALERRGTTLLDDVVGSAPGVPALLRGVEGIAERSGVLIGTFGHAGDGNMHPTVVYDHSRYGRARARAQAFDAILALRARPRRHRHRRARRRPAQAGTRPPRAGRLARTCSARSRSRVRPDGLLNPDKVPWAVG